MGTVKFIGQQLAKQGADLSFLPASASSGLWQAWQMPSGAVMLQALDMEKHPSGALLPLSKEVFEEIFTPVTARAGAVSPADPNLLKKWYIEALIADGQKVDLRIFYPEKFVAAEEDLGQVLSVAEDEGSLIVKSISAMLAAGESHSQFSGEDLKLSQVDNHSLKNNNLLSAEEYEEKVRAKFCQLLVRLSSLSALDAENVLLNILKRPEFAKPDLQYLITEFGLDLRREKKYYLALLCHKKALEFAPDDERILFNIARTEYELGEIDSACTSLEKALSVNPDFTVAENFLSFLKGKPS